MKHRVLTAAVALSIGALALAFCPWFGPVGMSFLTAGVGVSLIRSTKD